MPKYLYKSKYFKKHLSIYVPRFYIWSYDGILLNQSVRQLFVPFFVHFNKRIVVKVFFTIVFNNNGFIVKLLMLLRCRPTPRATISNPTVWAICLQSLSTASSASLLCLDQVIVSFPADTTRWHLPVASKAKNLSQPADFISSFCHGHDDGPDQQLPELHFYYL